jgi:hypothetical protein
MCDEAYDIIRRYLERSPMPELHHVLAAVPDEAPPVATHAVVGPQHQVPAADHALLAPPMMMNPHQAPRIGSGHYYQAPPIDTGLYYQAPPIDGAENYHRVVPTIDDVVEHCQAPPTIDGIEHHHQAAAMDIEPLQMLPPAQKRTASTACPRFLMRACSTEESLGLQDPEARRRSTDRTNSLLSSTA